jgi:hypothetical protein
MPVVSRMLAGIAFAVMAAMPWGGASAQSVADVMQQWGILGVWASDCGAPPSRRNYHLGYRAVGGGRVMHERFFGAGTDGQAVISAAIVGGTLELVVDFGPPGGTRRWTMFKGPDGRMRAWRNSRVDGSSLTVQDGRFTSDGRDTPWQTMCTRW